MALTDEQLVFFTLVIGGAMALYVVAQVQRILGGGR